MVATGADKHQDVAARTDRGLGRSRRNDDRGFSQNGDNVCRIDASKSDGP
jgi:hypothetical protein